MRNDKEVAGTVSGHVVLVLMYGNEKERSMIRAVHIDNLRSLLK